MLREMLYRHGELLSALSLTDPRLSLVVERLRRQHVQRRQENSRGYALKNNSDPTGMDIVNAPNLASRSHIRDEVALCK